ncbi:MAG: hypothetical protein ACM359_17485 [Bacillota bacterium]
MMLKVFGDTIQTKTDESETLPRVQTPVGSHCLWCAEPIREGDGGYMVPSIGQTDQPCHLACFIRQLVGSVAHQQRQCSCYGGSGEDDPALTRRQAAQAAFEEYMRAKVVVFVKDQRFQPLANLMQDIIAAVVPDANDSTRQAWKDPIDRALFDCGRMASEAMDMNIEALESALSQHLADAEDYQRQFLIVTIDFCKRMQGITQRTPGCWPYSLQKDKR